MIASVSGQVLDIASDSLVVEVGGVGLQVFVPSSLKDEVQPGEHVHLHTYLVVRQDALTLFGFASRDEKELFILLLGVNGVGPRLALATLSVLSPDAIRRAVFHDQPDVFSRVPGVGKKTGQKIVLHLQDRLPALTGLEQVIGISDVDSEVLGALTVLGYSVVEAQAALQSIPRETLGDIETRLRLALQYFS
jgi:Holliday junction DNA helicase RuvA